MTPSSEKRGQSPEAIRRDYFEAPTETGTQCSTLHDRHSVEARMSDQRLRELERRWRETGAVVDEAAYLLERVRVGDLDLERLELAAYCGSAAAKQASGTGSRSIEGPDLAALQGSFHGSIALQPGPEELLLLGAVDHLVRRHQVSVAIEISLRVIKALHDLVPVTDGAREALAAVTEWLAAPTPEAVEVAVFAAQTAADEADAVPRRSNDDGSAIAAAGFLAEAVKHPVMATRAIWTAIDAAQQAGHANWATQALQRTIGLLLSDSRSLRG